MTYHSSCGSFTLKHNYFNNKKSKQQRWIQKKNTNTTIIIYSNCVVKILIDDVINDVALLSRRITFVEVT